MSTQPTDSDTENPSDEHSSAGSAYGELLATSSLEELEEKPWEVKLALLQHHLELARIFVNKLLEEEVEETLTPCRLGVFEEVGRSLNTTNAIENLNSLVEDYIGNVKRPAAPSSGPDGSPLACWRPNNG